MPLRWRAQHSDPADSWSFRDRNAVKSAAGSDDEWRLTAACLHTIAIKTHGSDQSSCSSLGYYAGNLEPRLRSPRVLLARVGVLSRAQPPDTGLSSAQNRRRTAGSTSLPVRSRFARVKRSRRRVGAPDEREAGAGIAPLTSDAPWRIWRARLHEEAGLLAQGQIRVRIQPWRSLLRSPPISAYCLRALVKLSLGKFIVVTGTTGVG